MPETPTAIRQLILTLYEKHKRSELIWTAPMDEGDLYLSLGVAGTVNVYRMGEDDMRLAILDVGGAILETFRITETDLRGKLEEMHSAGVREVKGVDKRLDEMLKAAKQPGTLGIPF